VAKTETIFSISISNIVYFAKHYIYFYTRKVLTFPFIVERLENTHYCITNKEIQKVENVPP